MSPVKSLRELAIMVIFKNIREVDNIGYLSYDTVREVLLKVDSGAQLRQIELNSPQIQGQTGEIWVKLIERDFPLESRNRPVQPKDPKKWYRVWEKYKVEQERFLTESENKLKSALTHLRQEEEKKTSKIIQLAAIPTHKKGALKRPRFPTKSSSTLSFGGGSRTKAVNGASVMRKVRREVKEIAKIHGSLSRPINAPIGRALTKAPEAMVNDHKRAALPQYRPANPRDPTQLSEDLKLELEFDPHAGVRYLTEAALEDYSARASYLSDSEETGDSGIARSKQPASAALKLAAKPAAKPAAKTTPKAPTSALQRKFAGSKSAFKAPLASSAPVIKARESAPEPKQPERKQLERKQHRSRAYPAPDLPKEANSPPKGEQDLPSDALDLLVLAEQKAAAAREASAPAEAAKIAKIYRKRRNPDLFATHPRKRRAV